MTARAAVVPHPPGIRRASEIVAADRKLRRAFLLTSLSAGPQELGSDDRAARFLLWFALAGRHRYPDVAIVPDYLAFLAEPCPPYPSRLAAFLRLARPELRQRFEADVAGYVDWYYSAGAQEAGVGPLVTARETLSRTGRASVTQQARPRPLADRSHLPGVNIFGFADAVMGIGEDARALAEVLMRAGVPVCLVNLGLADGIGTTTPDGLDMIHSPHPLFPVNLFALPPVETARLVAERGEGLLQGRTNIGWWPWELTSLPEAWHGVFDLVDEIWAPSAFLETVYRGLTRKPVITVPPYLNLPEVEPFDRQAIGIDPSSPLFLALFDYNSFVARKNPAGAIAAFQRAFADRSGPERLLVKTINAAAHPKAHADLVASALGDPRIRFFDEALSRPRLAGLVAACDVFVSLHRSEGFGRVVAEAMALGTRVAATAWSGPCDFLDEDVGDPVAFRLRDVEPGEYILSQGSRWAEPDLDDAAIKLRRARDALGSDTVLRQRARMRVLDRYGLDAVASRVVARLEVMASGFR